MALAKVRRGTLHRGLLAFAGVMDGEDPLPTLGQIRSTVTSSRQIQLGLRVEF